VTCSRGVDAYLAQEIASRGFSVLTRTQAGVETEGSMKDAMDLNLHLRDRTQVLLRTAEFAARDPDDLYRKIIAISVGGDHIRYRLLSITSTVELPSIDNSRFANQKCKDAIADRL